MLRYFKRFTPIFPLAAAALLMVSTPAEGKKTEEVKAEGKEADKQAEEKKD